MGSAVREASDFARSSISLGRRSLRPAAGILLTLAGIELVRACGAGAITADTATLSPETNAVGQVLGVTLSLGQALIVSTGAILLMPLQDRLARGETSGGADALRVVLRRLGALAWSGVFQTALVFIPPLTLAVALLIPAARTMLEAPGALDPTAYQAIVSAVTHAVVLPSACWVIGVNVFLLFATPYLLLENRGPLRSLRLSAALVARRVLPYGSRFASLGLLWLALGAAALIPGAAMHAATGPDAGGSAIGLLASAVWSAASTVLALAFGTAGLVVLFRSLVPSKP